MHIQVVWYSIKWWQTVWFDSILVIVGYLQYPVIGFIVARDLEAQNRVIFKELAWIGIEIEIKWGIPYFWTKPYFAGGYMYGVSVQLAIIIPIDLFFVFYWITLKAPG